MKRLTAVLLSALMLLPALASLASCGSGQETGSGTASANETNEEHSESETSECDLPSDLDFQKKEVNFIYVDISGKQDELVSDGSSGLISEAVYERNELVTNQLNVTLNFIPDKDDDIATKVKNDISSNLGSYDIVVNGTYKSVTPAVEGQYLDLSRVSYIDTSKSYWTQGFNDLVTFTPQKKQYVVSGDAAISMFRYVFLTLYNRTEMEAHKLPDMYETIKSGNWTLDTQLSLVQGLYQDKNNNNKKDTGDYFGFVTGNASSIDPYLVASDIHLVVKDPDTQDLVFDADALKRVSDLQEKVSALYNDPAVHYYEGGEGDWAGKTKNIINDFTAGNALMVTCLFLDMETEIESLSAMSYGIAPIPKFDTTQEQYCSYVQDQVSCFGISAGVKDADRVSMLGAVLESLAYNSSKTIPHAYYNTNLSLKFMQNPQSTEILDLIFDTIQFDFSSTCSNMFGRLVLRDQLRPLLCSPTNRVSSSTRRWSDTMGNILKDINSKINNLS